MARKPLKVPFHSQAVKNKFGEVAVIKHSATGFRSISVCGKVKVPNCLEENRSLHNEIHQIGLNFLHLFPDILVQKSDASIITFSLPINPSPKRTLWYDFHYILNGNTDTDVAIQTLLLKNNVIAEKISAYTKWVQEQSCGL